MKNNYLTIKELSEIVGKSPQSFYKRINKKDDVFNSYVKKINGKILIDKKILEEIYQTEKDNSTEFKKVGNQDNNQVELINSLKRQVEFQEKEINQKNDQINNLLDRVAELTKALDQQQQLAVLDKQNILKLEEDTAAEERNKGFFKRFFNK